jgi:hypothetical protein
MKQLLTLILAMTSGFIGGSIASHLQSQSPATPGIVRASRFELIDESGRRISAWERDSRGQSLMTFVNKDGNELATFGLLNTGSPFLNMTGRDGKVRLTLGLGAKDKPLLGMGDEKWEGRVLLGFIENDTPSARDENGALSASDDDWVLLFRAPGHISDLASIGAISNRAGAKSGEISVRSSTGKRWSVPE